jgi:hypothetical protein
MSLKRVNFSPLHTFARATVKNVFQPEPDGFGGTDYILKEVASGAPAFAWNPETGESLGISIEESRTNYMANNVTPTYSVIGAGFVVTTRVETVKGVSCTVLNVVHDGSAAGGIYFTPASMPVSSSANPSFYVKNISNTANLQCRDLASTANGLVDFTGIPSDGEFHRIGVGVSSVTVTTQFNTNTATPRPYFSVASGVAREYEICLPMMEVGTFTTSLILTSGSTLTRLADVVTVPDLSGWFNASEGEFKIQVITPNAAAKTAFSISSDSSAVSNNSIYLARDPAWFRLVTYVGGSRVDTVLTGTPTGNDVITIKYGGGQLITAQLNDNAVVTDASNSLPTGLTNIRVGGIQSSTTGNLGGSIGFIKYNRARG